MVIGLVKNIDSLFTSHVMIKLAKSRWILRASMKLKTQVLNLVITVHPLEFSGGRRGESE